jgi:hypothetical protein
MSIFDIASQSAELSSSTQVTFKKELEVLLLAPDIDGERFDSLPSAFMFLSFYLIIIYFLDGI